MLALRSFKSISIKEIPNFVWAISFELVAPTTLVHLFFDGTAPVWQVARMDEKIRKEFKREFEIYGENGASLIIVPRPVFSADSTIPVGYFVFDRSNINWSFSSSIQEPKFTEVKSLDDPRLEPLNRWNKLSRENSENAITNSMFEATFLASEPIDNFATWLLAAGAAVGSFLIINADKVLPLLGARGYLTCGLAICASCLFGLLSKLAGLQLKNALITRKKTAESFAEEIKKHQEEEKKIQEGAKFWGIEMETEIRMARVLSEYFRLMPKIAAWFTKRLLKNNEGDPQIANILPAKLFKWQGLHVFLQALGWLIFLVAGLAFAAINFGK